MLDKSSYRVLSTAEEVSAAVRILQNESLISLDTETFWDHAANQPHVSLVQIAPPQGEVMIIDALATDARLLQPIVESPAIQMAAHNARFDEGVLLGAGLRPVSFVDTLRLARSALRLPSYSLAEVSAHLFGIALDKSFQKSNWRRRPLTRAQLDYAAMDAYVTLRVYEELLRILAEQGRVEDALRVARLTPARNEPGAPRKRRAPPTPLRPLTGEEKNILIHLKKWRLEKSRDEHVPAYMICPDRTLAHLAMERPTTLEALAAIHGLGASRIERYGEALLETLRRVVE